MTVTCARLVAMLAAALALSIGAGAAGPQAAPRSAWSGVFNQEQVERGKTAFNAQCARCHGETLGGGENSPPLVDDPFFAFWNGKSVGELVEYTRTKMPSDGPGTISRKKCIDMAAYLLSANGFPAGTEELPLELEALNEIAITRTK